MTTPFPDGITSFFQKGIKTHTSRRDILVIGVTATSVARALNGRVSTPNAKSGNIQSLPLARWDILT
jgi:hypothetical protein